MPAIAIVDDRADLRGTVARHLRAVLKAPAWEVIEDVPLAELGDYPAWLAEKDIVALVLDERLREGGAEYEGHDLVEFLRGRIPSFPMFVVTAYPDDPDLATRFGQVEEIISRQEFAQRAAEYATRLVRAGTRFSEQHQADLAELGDLAAKIATGHATVADVQQAHAIRVQLGIEFAVAETRDRAEGLRAFEERIAEYDAQRRRLSAQLGRGAGDARRRAKKKPGKKK